MHSVQSLAKIQKNFILWNHRKRFWR